MSQPTINGKPVTHRVWLLDKAGAIVAGGTPCTSEQDADRIAERYLLDERGLVRGYAIPVVAVLIEREKSVLR